MENDTTISFNFRSKLKVVVFILFHPRFLYSKHTQTHIRNITRGSTSLTIYCLLWQSTIETIENRKIIKIIKKTFSIAFKIILILWWQQYAKRAKILLWINLISLLKKKISNKKLYKNYFCYRMRKMRV